MDEEGDRSTSPAPGNPATAGQEGLRAQGPSLHPFLPQAVTFVIPHPFLISVKAGIFR